MAGLELSLKQGQFGRARQHSEKIDVQYLFPTERQWLQQARQQLNAHEARNS